MLPTVAIVGRPNVGKSSLFNRMIGERLAITDDASGITRDRMYAQAEWLGKQFNVIDTGGIELSDAPFLTEIKAQVEIAIEEADVIVMVTDGRSGMVDDDRFIMKMLYAVKKPILIAVNKVDDQKYVPDIYDFYQLGGDDVIGISTHHGIGMGDLLDRIVAVLPEKEADPYDESTIRIALIGRPNVGKSSLTNAILGEERVIVSPIQGTTTDAIDTPFTSGDQSYVVIDTAGLRKRGKLWESVEKYSALRAMQAIDRSDVVLLVIDAETGIIEQDKHIAGYALDHSKAMILVVNKWDTIQKNDATMSEWIQKLRYEFQFLTYIPIAFVSAKNKQRIPTLFPLIQKAFENYQRRISTSVLNEVITDAISLNPPKDHNRIKLKVYYATQVAIKCPTFVLFVNEPEAMHFSYQRYLENRLRERFDFEGTPIKIILRKRD